MGPSSEEWLTAARLLRPQGRHGELLAQPHVDASILTAGRRLWLRPEGSLPREPAMHRVLNSWNPSGRNAGRIVLKLEGVDSISSAELLAGQLLLMHAADLPALEEGTFRVRDLIGCALYNGLELAGTVIEIQFPVAPDGRTRFTEAPDLLVVEPTSRTPGEAEPVLVPFARAWLTGVDLASRRIDMQLPPGLFEVSASGTLEDK